jgi:hypothetical protein
MTVAFYTTEFNTAVKSFMIQALKTRVSCMETFVIGKARYVRPPFTNKFRPTAFNIDFPPFFY